MKQYVLNDKQKAKLTLKYRWTPEFLVMPDDPEKESPFIHALINGVPYFQSLTFTEAIKL